MINLAELETAQGWIAAANHLTVLTGAGISAESGVPTFRGEGGLWRNQGFMELANARAFQRDPQAVWAWYRWRQDMVRACEPNAAHIALAEFEHRQPGRITVVTQNVDRLHQRAGSRSTIELHGDLFADRCIGCGLVHPCHDSPATGPADPSNPDQDPPLLHCRACNLVLRPGVVWFGESLPADAMQMARNAISSSDVLLVIGTSGVVMPAASLVTFASRSNIKCVTVNTESTNLDGTVDLELIGPAGLIVPALLSV